ncbi:MAG: 30S ribosomal protein S4 [Chitinophagales bacterium]|nr:30S ribosomal protein S4 [Chitinophagales bacterium]MDW8427537.1 30S ribosomal protein S4 [Chitinophagales bacterium]
MARYIGPRAKVSRTFGEPILGFSKALEKKNYPPGIHGTARKRRQPTQYAIQLQEKQKAKMTYGLLERQFARFYREAVRTKGVTGENLMRLLESRLDNTVYRLGLAPTRRGARQLVSHRHIMLNGKVTNIPSLILKPGDVVGVVPASRELEVIKQSLANHGHRVAWLEWNSDKWEGKFLSYPQREQIPENIKEQLIVELYSK